MIQSIYLAIVEDGYYHIEGFASTKEALIKILKKVNISEDYYSIKKINSFDPNIGLVIDAEWNKVITL